MYCIYNILTLTFYPICLHESGKQIGLDFVGSIYSLIQYLLLLFFLFCRVTMGLESISRKEQWSNKCQTKVVSTRSKQMSF